MTKYIPIILFIISSVFTIEIAGAHPRHFVTAHEKGSISLSDSNCVVLPYTSSEFSPFKKGKGTTLAKAEIKEIESLSNAAIKEYNRTTKWGLIDKDYKVQLIAIINDKGEKQVWVNCFCGAMSGWRKSIVYVMDGGNCFFNLRINLTKGEYYDLAVNGYA
jgi:hypothetical protein